MTSSCHSVAAPKLCLKLDMPLACLFMCQTFSQDRVLTPPSSSTKSSHRWSRVSSRIRLKSKSLPPPSSGSFCPRSATPRSNVSSRLASLAALSSSSTLPTLLSNSKLPGHLPTSLLDRLSKPRSSSTPVLYQSSSSSSTAPSPTSGNRPSGPSETLLVTAHNAETLSSSAVLCSPWSTFLVTP